MQLSSQLFGSYRSSSYPVLCSWYCLSAHLPLPPMFFSKSHKVDPNSFCLLVPVFPLVSGILGGTFALQILWLILNNYWMRLSMISWIIKNEVCVIRLSLRLRLHRHEVLIIHDIMQKPNSIIVLLYIFHIIHPQKQKRSIQPFCFWGEHSKGLSNQADVELDMINAISAVDIAFIMSSSQAFVNWLNALDQSDFS